ncbi:MAG TPA: hypothetical protein VEZ11_05540 [Thermoanaerobaculia bacterium]|nr:hypothetical protein [Thermoanaerobaculia bacterium]
MAKVHVPRGNGGGIASVSPAASSAEPHDLDSAIEMSKSLLDLGPDWDDAGAKPIDASTWKRATGFLRRTMAKATRSAGPSVPVPRISPCSDGSIDLFWKRPGFQLLINIQPSGTVASDFYGETPNGFELKGTFDPDTHDLNVILGQLLVN